jgi:hypothetical protein
MTTKHAISIAPMIIALADEVLALRCKYQNGEQIDHAVGEVRNALENLEDAMKKNRESA